MDEIFDVVIVGGGPAGLAAGIYASRAKLNTLILEKGVPGGQIMITHEIENYPCAVEGESGPSLIDKMVKQVNNFGAKIVRDTMLSIDNDGAYKIVVCEKNSYKTKTVIIANGGKPRPIGCKGERSLVGKGVSYCATCDANFFVDLEVYVIGGGDTAVEEALYLTKFARKVTIVHRRDELRAAKSIVEKANKNEKIAYIWDSVVEEIKGDGIVEAMVLKNVKTNELTQYDACEDDGTFGVFVFVGYDPVSTAYKGTVDMDDYGYIIADEQMNTNVPGIFVAGDIRVKSFRQVVTAVSDGAIAANEAEKYINEKF